MTRFNVLIAVMAVLLCIVAVGAQTTSTPRRALRVADSYSFDDFKSEFESYFHSDDGGDGGDGGDGHWDWSTFNDWGFDENWHSGDDFDSDGFKSDISDAFSSFKDELKSILESYRN